MSASRCSNTETLLGGIPAATDRIWASSVVTPDSRLCRRGVSSQRDRRYRPARLGDVRHFLLRRGM